VHGVWLSYYRHPAAGLKQKNPPPYGSGFGKSGENSKPVRRAGQQRARKQQVQVVIHEATIAHLICLVIGKIVEWSHAIQSPAGKHMAAAPSLLSN